MGSGPRKLRPTVLLKWALNGAAPPGMRAIIQSLIQLGGMQFVMATTAVVRNKVLAVRLGTEGFGEFSQLALVVGSLSVLVAFGLSLSLNRHVAAAPDQFSRQRLLANANGMIVVLTTALLGFALLYALPGRVPLDSVGLERRPELVAALVLMLTLVPLEAAVKHRIAFLTAVLDISGMAAGRSAALIAGTVAAVPVVWFFGLVGAAIQTVMLTLLMLVLLDRRCRVLGYRPWHVSFEPSTVRFLAGMGMASLAAGFAQQITDVSIRSMLIQRLDASQNGLYQAALSIVYQVKAIVLGSVGSYSLATLSKDTSQTAVRTMANRLLSVVLPVGAVAFAAIGLLSGPAFHVLFSAEFLPARTLLPFLLSAEFAQVLVWVLGAPLLARRRIGSWLAIQLAFSAARAATAFALVPLLGTVGVAVGYLVATAIQLTLTAIVYRFDMGFSLSRRSLWLFTGGLALTATASWLGAREVSDVGSVSLGLLLIGAFILVTVHVTVGLRESARYVSSLVSTKLRRRR